MSATDVFAQKKFLEDIFNSEICYRLISNWTLCRTMQGAIVLVISNRPRASRSSDFEITRAISPWIVLHSVQLLLLISFLPITVLNISMGSTCKGRTISRCHRGRDYSMRAKPVRYSQSDCGLWRKVLYTVTASGPVATVLYISNLSLWVGCLTACDKKENMYAR